MPESLFEELRRYVGFTDADALRVRALGPRVAPAFPAAIERFYAVIEAHAGTRAVLAEPGQIDRLRVSLHDWLHTLVVGPYDDAYFLRRQQIGRAHVRVGLSQHYMVCAMEVLWQSLAAAARVPPDAAVEPMLDSLHKLFTLELAVMLDSYKDSYSAQVRAGEREAVHERLTRAEHLAHIGQLAASLAHEIKNPLAGISGAIQVLRDGLARDDDRRPVLHEVLRQINRLDGTVKDLLVYARPKPLRTRPVDIPRLIERVLTVLREEPDMQRVRVEHHPADVPPVDADEDRVEQLLINLMLNAAQSSPEGAVVRVSATRTRDAVRLLVEDRGAGMSPDVLRRATEPFFTTKARGTGLGLPICQKIADAHGGRLEIRSVVGKGTTVIVVLPLGAPPTRPGGSSE
ncbi:MAG: protoglobin domain-containing protein [Phycisphaerae bacterium]